MPTVEFGRLGVYWTLDHTIKCAAGGIGGKIRIATLRKIDGKWAASEVLETEEPAQFISEIEAQIGSQALRVVEDAKASRLPFLLQPISHNLRLPQPHAPRRIQK
jgi:hypothetical protein